MRRLWLMAGVSLVVGVLPPVPAVGHAPARSASCSRPARTFTYTDAAIETKIRFDLNKCWHKGKRFRVRGQLERLAPEGGALFITEKLCGRTRDYCTFKLGLEHPNPEAATYDFLVTFRRRDGTRARIKFSKTCVTSAEVTECQD